MIPPRYCYHVIEVLRVGFNPVSIALYYSTDYRDAAAYLETRLHLATRKRKFFIKHVAPKADAGQGGEWAQSAWEW